MSLSATTASVTCGEMVPFRKHLGTDKDLRLLPAKDSRISSMPRGGGCCPDPSAEPGLPEAEASRYILFDTLGSLPHGMEMQPLQLGQGRERNRIPAVVADQPLSPLCGRSNRYHNADIGPPSHSRCSTSVEHNRADSGESPPDPLLHRLLECGERLRSQNGLDAVHGPDVHQPIEGGVPPPTRA